MTNLEQTLLLQQPNELNFSQSESSELLMKEEQTVDPIFQLKQKNNIIPILTVLNNIPLDLLVDEIPLLSLLCQKYIPFEEYIQKDEIPFALDKNGRSALQYAIEADNVKAAAWCCRHHILNTVDQYGSNAFHDTIRLGRRRIFMLCVLYKYYDDEGLFLCAEYNRVWELKMLKACNVDICHVKFNNNGSLLEKALESNSYETVEYLSKQRPSKIPIEDVRKKTDSEAMIRIVQKTNFQKNNLKNTFIKLITFIIIISISSVGCYRMNELKQIKNIYFFLMLSLAFVLFPLSLIPLLKQKKQKQTNKQNNILQLLKFPNFPPLETICPICLQFQLPHYTHCDQCGKCVKKFHHHLIICFNADNQVFFFIFDLLKMYLFFSINRALTESITTDHLQLYAITNPLVMIANIVDILVQNNHFLQATFFLFIKILLLHSIFKLLQWLCMMALNRTYDQLHRPQHYPQLYEVVKNGNGKYCHREKKIMANGLIKGLLITLKNIVTYFIV